jgi:zinc transporter ZupT
VGKVKPSPPRYERSMLRSGCLSLVVRVGVVSVAAVLAALSTVLILSFAVSALGQPDGVEKIIKVILATAAGFAFFLVGRGIWRDLRRHSSAEPEEGPTEERGP